MDELRKAEAAAPDGQPPYESPVMKAVDESSAFHLFIDDIDKTAARTGFRLEAMFDLFDTMKRKQLSLSVTSNVPLYVKDSKRDLRAKLSDPVASRIYALCKAIEI